MRALRPSKRQRSNLPIAILATLAVGGATLGCSSERPLSILGYRIGANQLYDTSIRTVYVPTFHNQAFQTTPYRGLEVEITKAVIREIEAKTPYKVVSDPQQADTELIGNLVGIDKALLNRNQQNTIREGEVTLRVEVLWRDLRDGRILSNPRLQGNQPIPLPVQELDIPPFDPNVPAAPPPMQVQEPLPVLLVSTGRMLPELGESNATAAQLATQRLATQIVSMMERPWTRGNP